MLDSRGTRRITVIAMAVAMVSAALVLYVHWRVTKHDVAAARVLYPYAGIENTYNAGRVGATFYADAGVILRHPSSAQNVVHLLSVRPVIAVNTAQATITMLVCVHAQARIGIGATTSTYPECSSARPVAPGPLDLGSPTNQIIFAIAAHRPGTVRVNGSQAIYRNGSDLHFERIGVGTIDHVHTGIK